MFRTTTYKIIYLVVSIFAIAALTYFLYQNFIAADIEISANGDQKLLDFSADIGKKMVFLRFENKKGEIIVKKNLANYCRHSLSGFESSVKIDGTLDINDQLKLVEISGPVGIHSRSKQFFFLDQNHCPQPTVFVKDGQRMYNIFSDQPSFKIADFNGDNYPDIAAEYRNYDLNPLIDGIREVYYFNFETKSFVYDHSENYQDKENCLNCTGEIK